MLISCVVDMSNKKPLTISIRGFIFVIDMKSIVKKLIINHLMINRYLPLQNQHQ
jgi:hypothetical protein